jgi:large subunit ribosomal protein L25
MEKILVQAEKRTEIGKGRAKRLRRQEVLPAVLYSQDVSIPIQLQRKQIAKLIASGVGEHALITIALGEGKGKKKEHATIIKDYQLDPVNHDLLHVDFMEISLKKNIKITIPVVITKEPMGVKKGGIVQQQLREVEIECLPTQIPEGIEVDASSIDIGHSIHVSDLVIKEGVKLLTDLNDVVMTVSAPIIEEEPKPAVEEEVTEPELVKKAKEKEEGEPEEEEKKGEEKEKEKGKEKEKKEKKEK